LAGKILADKIYTTPSVTINSTSEEKLNYVMELNRIALENNIGYIIPIRTGDVMALTEFHNRLSPFTKALIPTESIDKFNMLNDKLLLMNLLEELGLLCPIYTTFKNVEEFDIKANEILSKMNNSSDKVVIKPRVQSGSRGMRIMSLNMNNDEKWEQFINKKLAENILMTKKQLIATAGWTRTFDMIMMEYLPGDEYTVDCLCKNGKLIKIVVRKRLKTDNGISSIAEIVPCETAIYQTCNELIKFLGLSYNVGFQFKENSIGIPKLIECNPRLQGTTCFSIEAGADLIWGAFMIARNVDHDNMFSSKTYNVIYMERIYKELYSKEVPK
jgi:carbamoyl-phosphate synthase large subunit